jgi:hypothetical protein
MRGFLLFAGLIAGCATTKKPVVYEPGEATSSTESSSQEEQPPPTDSGTQTSQPPPADKPPEPARMPEMYALDEALADVLSGPLVHIGTGPWYAVNKINACAYRNERVIVINVYCTQKEMEAFSIIVLSPTKGRASFYAESGKVVSGLKRAQYLSFKGETQPLAGLSLPPVSLKWNYGEVAAWDEKRHKKYAAACYGGTELKKPQSGCLRTLQAHAATWQERNQPFLDNPPEDWYRIVREMRAKAKQDGKNVSNAGG